MYLLSSLPAQKPTCKDYEWDASTAGGPEAPRGECIQPDCFLSLGYGFPCSVACRVLTLDNRGVGRSSAPKNQKAYSTDRMADDVLAVLDRLRWDSAHVVGHRRVIFIHFGIHLVRAEYYAYMHSFALQNCLLSRTCFGSPLSVKYSQNSISACALQQMYSPAHRGCSLDEHASSAELEFGTS